MPPDDGAACEIDAELMVLMLRTLEGDPRLATAFDALKHDAERAGLLAWALTGRAIAGQ